MNYLEFARTLNTFPCFSTREIMKYFPGFDRRRLVEWQAKGYIQKLRNSHYCFSDHPDEENFRHYLANQLYKPSYISLESALAWYGFIPEAVFQMISCSTRKSQRFETPRAIFVYRHIKKELFFGYRLISRKLQNLSVAEPEKALIDYLYLHSEIQGIDDLLSLRWNTFAINEQISRKTMDHYEKVIASPILSHRLNLLKELLDA